MSINSIFKRLSVLLAGTLLIMLTITPAAAQNGGSSDTVVSDFLEIYNTSTNKVAQLADAMPDDKLDWRPAEGIRSAKEAILHIASANYFFGSQLGMEIPEGIDPQSMEQSDISKEKAMNVFKESVAFVRKAFSNMEPAVFDEELDLFGNTFTKRQVMYIVGSHAAEHLGQLIAYARMNGVTPPWSQPEN